MSWGSAGELMAKEIRRPPPPTRAFQDLKGTVAANLSVDQYDQLVSDAYLEESNMKLLQDIDLIGGSKQSSGGPRAGSSQVVSVGADDTGSFVFYQASEGEVWLLEAMTIEATTSGTWTLAVELNVGTESMTIIPTTSKTDTFLYLNSVFGWPTANTYLDENTKIGITLGGSFSGITVRALMTRYR
jgi:hypothetical protein